MPNTTVQMLFYRVSDPPRRLRYNLFAMRAAAQAAWRGSAVAALIFTTSAPRDAAASAMRAIFRVASTH